MVLNFIKDLLDGDDDKNGNGYHFEHTFFFKNLNPQFEKIVLDQLHQHEGLIELSQDTVLPLIINEVKEEDYTEEFIAALEGEDGGQKLGLYRILASGLMTLDRETSGNENLPESADAISDRLNYINRIMIREHGGDPKTGGYEMEQSDDESITGMYYRSGDKSITFGIFDPEGEIFGPLFHEDMYKEKKHWIDCLALTFKAKKKLVISEPGEAGSMDDCINDRILTFLKFVKESCEEEGVDFPSVYYMDQDKNIFRLEQLNEEESAFEGQYIDGKHSWEENGENVYADTKWAYHS
jgi:hypothetical protein